MGKVGAQNEWRIRLGGQYWKHGEQLLTYVNGDGNNGYITGREKRMTKTIQGKAGVVRR